MMLRLTYRLIWLGLLGLILSGTFAALAATNTVEESGLSRSTHQATANELKPSECTMSLAEIRLSSGGTGTTNSLILGTTGNDNYRGRQGDDCILGGAGNDTFDGDQGDDVILGGTGDDPYLFGDRGNDTIYGGAGNDTLDGGRDTDTCRGDSGTDTFNACETQIQ
jgi:Ca2+-binding RTX toxin-like protein